MMKTNINDVQQLEKKKYVGNDSVHIIWCENDRDYKPGTITGSFNFVHIIIYPMRNGLYRIRIETKKNDNSKTSKFFGPVISGMILTMNMLPILIRLTAIDARRKITFKSLKMVNPISERRKTIERILSKHSKKSVPPNDQQFQLIKKFIGLNETDI